MGIHWRNKAIKVSLLVALGFALVGCKAKKVISENIATESIERSEKIEKIVVQEPYKMEVKEEIHFDTIGEIKIKPIRISIKKDNIVGEVVIENNEITYSLEKVDTTIVSREVKEVTTTDTKTDTVKEVEVRKSFFERVKSFSRTLIILAIVIGVLFIGFKLFRKGLLPI